MRKFFYLFLFHCTLLFSDSGYNDSFVSLVEYLYGKGYLSQGGASSVYSQFQGIALENKRLLNIGSGLGGPDIDLARTHQVDITGIDPEEFLVVQAQKNALTAKDQLSGTLSFQVTKDPLTLSQFATASFDIITSRESLLHIPIAAKLPFFKEMARVLAPKGKLIIVDWVRNAPFSEKTLKMMKMDGVAFHLITLQEYKQNLIDAGFKNVAIEDETSKYIAYSENVLEKLLSSAPEFKERFGEDAFYYSSMSWTFQKEAFQRNEIHVVKITCNI